MSELVIHYDQDFCAWVGHHVTLLRQRRFSELDIDNLIEELESLSKVYRQQLINRLAVLLRHLLKWQFVSHKRSNSWKFTIKEQRERIRLLLQDSPSLKYQLADRLQNAYGLAVLKALKEAPQDEGKFPETCPFSLEQILDNQFYPD